VFGGATGDAHAPRAVRVPEAFALDFSSPRFPFVPWRWNRSRTTCVLATCRPNLSERGSSKLRAAGAALCPRGPAWPPRRRRRAVCDVTAPSRGLRVPRSTRLFRHLGTRRRMLRANLLLGTRSHNASPTSRATGVLQPYQRRQPRQRRRRRRSAAVPAHQCQA